MLSRDTDLDGLRNELVMAFQETEVIVNSETAEWDTATVHEAQRMADLVIAVLTHPAVR